MLHKPGGLSSIPGTHIKGEGREPTPHTYRLTSLDALRHVRVLSCICTHMLYRNIFLVCFALFCTQEQESMFRSLPQSFMLWLELSPRQSLILSLPISCSQLERISSEREDSSPQDPCFLHLRVCFQCDGACIEDRVHQE